jgi:hypothetical protein
MSSLAAIIYNHVEISRRSSEAILETIQKIDGLHHQVLDDCAWLAQQDSVATLSETSWWHWQAYNFAFALRLVDLNLCRVALGPSLQSEQTRNKLHERAVRVATEMADLRQSPVPKLFQTTWWVALNYCPFVSS